MNDTVVLGGECTLVNYLDGTCVLTDVVDGVAHVVLKVTEADYYTGEYTVTPLADSSVVLETYQKLMADNVTVEQVPYYETHNTDGITVYIASEVA